MRGSNRRDVMRAVFVAALTVPLAMRPTLGQAIQGNLIDPPSDTMLYRRSVARDMFDGAVFRVTREFALQFRRHADGFWLQGRQHQVSVEAPQSLARFAELERERDETSLFPMELDPFGRLLSVQASYCTDEEIRRAVDSALETFAAHGIADGERERMERFIAAIHEAGQRITAHLPVDLFAPAGAPRRAEQRILLPDGSEGHVETTFEGELDGATGLMRSATRQIVTEVGTSRRTTRERWSLVLA